LGRSWLLACRETIRRAMRCTRESLPGRSSARSASQSRSHHLRNAQNRCNARGHTNGITQRVDQRRFT
ncbi:hypothetical protein BE221DRAFT_64733, partial [Ostreococcus tauri]